MKYILLLATSLVLSNSYAQYDATTSDINKNWTVVKSLTYSGTVKTITKQYYDYRGHPTQTQSRNMTYSQILANETINDAMGRPVIKTMVAPINNANFGYKTDFMYYNDGIQEGPEYSYLNFDDAKTNNPDPVGGKAIAGTLGWYYSNNNTLESRVPTSDYPFTRTDYYRDGSAAIKRVSGVGNAFRMGQGREMSTYVYPAVAEFTHYIQARNKYFTNSEVGELPSHVLLNSSMNVSKDINGNDEVTMTDSKGNVLMSARIGNDNTFYCNSGVTADTRYSAFIDATDILIILPQTPIEVYTGATLFYSGPASGFTVSSLGAQFGNIRSAELFSYQWCSGGGCSGVQYAIPQRQVHYFRISSDNTFVSITGSGTYTLYDMATETPITLTGNILNKGYYKMVANTGSNSITYSNSYADISYYFYNQMGQMVAKVAPEGVKKLIQNINAYATKASVPFITLMEYDLRGKLIASTTTDGGRTELIYRKDGLLRFSQNARQQANGWFSYNNYDEVGRVTESGEYHPNGDITFAALKTNTAILEDISSTGGLANAANKYDWIKTMYDVEDNSHGQSGYSQQYTRGAISKTETQNSKTWYSYDDQSRGKWTIKWISGLGYKTTDYYYDAEGKATKIVYQQNTPAETFVHYYEYNADEKLERIYTNTVDNPLTKSLQAKYIYYLHGPVKRIEIGDNIQGLDYTYVLDGRLKAINHSNVANDPGADGSNGFLQDAFGEIIEYYNNDYIRSGTNIGSIAINNSDAPEQYGGLIRGMSWFSKKPPASGASANPNMYVFKYDPKYQFAEATWGSISGSNFVPQVGVNKETVTGYDMHGNIQNLTRTNDAPATVDNFLYNYINSPAFTNKLGSITQQTTAQNYATYEYDVIGQMTRETPGPAYGSGLTKYVQYDMAGKVTGVYSDQPMTIPIVKFLYDEAGKRIKKLSYASGVLNTTTYYVYDAGGSLMSVYEQSGVGAIVQSQLPVYGSGKRLGVYFKSSAVYRYELNDHLGNVRAVFYKNAPNTIQMVVYRDYYPFGMPILNRQYTDADGYRYGYQGQYSERDPETNWNAFELRMYDSKIGRWMSVDPKSQFWSPYAGMGNEPISQTDPDGGSTEWKPDKETGHLEMEAGDNLETLYKFFEGTKTKEELTKMLEAQGLTVKDGEIFKADAVTKDLKSFVGGTVKLDNVYTTALQWAKDHPEYFVSIEDYEKGVRTKHENQREQYNCHGSTLRGTQGKPIVIGTGNSFQQIVDSDLTTKYENVKADDAVFGITAIRFSGNHTCVYYGRDKEGNIYVFTKNGWNEAPKIMKLDDLKELSRTTPGAPYGKPAGVEKKHTPYYKYTGSR